MRENRTYGSEGGEPSNGSLPYPYQGQGTALMHCLGLTTVDSEGTEEW